MSRRDEYLDALLKNLGTVASDRTSLIQVAGGAGARCPRLGLVAGS